MMEEEEIEINFKKFKTHHRKFPWAFLFRIIMLIVSVVLIYFVLKLVKEKTENRTKKDFEIEIEI